MGDITGDVEKTAEALADHFATTAMMKLPRGTNPQEFMVRVADKFLGKCNEKITEATRRASLQRQ